ncbi:MAG: D-alanyl-D-alanine carboxypeptidase, partial [Methylobacteriaceae bacterium]|nr:D-alanyl-D-alanine carboxypeptidase [Methylobacteriaceae bacterium]
MLRRVYVRRLGLALLATTFGTAALTTTSTPAEARRHHHRKASASRSVYAPPFSAMVVDANTGRSMYAVNEDEPRHPASITKVMTLYLLFEQLERGGLKLDSELTATARCAAQAPSKIGLRSGQTIEVEDAIKALVTKSANDAACTIAENLADSEEEFAEKMTRKARQLGMSRTVYRNASGLPNP